MHMTCEFCGRFPHDPRCPNANLPGIIGYCEVCGEELTTAYEYYTDNEGRLFCT